MINRKHTLHVFYVQSPISLLVSQAIVAHKQLPQDSIFYILDRGVSAPEGYSSQYGPDFLVNSPSKSFRSILKNRKRRFQALRYIREMSQERPVELYTNKMSNSVYLLFKASGCLQSVNIYEEGFAAYHAPLLAKPPHIRMFKEWRRVLINTLSGFPLHKSAFYLNEYKEAFSTSSDAFVGFPRRTVLDIKPMLTQEIMPEALSAIPNGALIFALPQLFSFRNNPKLSKALEDIMVWCFIASNGNVLFKMHPTRYDFSDYCEYLSSAVKERVGIDFRDQLAPEISLEVVGFHRSDVIIAVIISSIAVYARFFTCRVVSFAGHVYDNDFHLFSALRRASPATFFASSLEEFSDSIGFSHIDQ